MKQSLVFLLIASATPLSCKHRNFNSHSNIVRGTLVEESDSVYKATLSLDAHGKPFCSAVAFDKRTVITAAHCIKTPPQGPLAVTAGNSTSENKKSIPVNRQQMRPHAGWDPSDLRANDTSPLPTKPKNDIGVIVLDEDLPSWITPVPIKLVGGVSVGDRAILAGFGMTRMQGPNGVDMTIEARGLMRRTEVLIETINDNGWEFVYKPTAERNSGTACHGDSGGPMYFKESNGSITLIGVTSRAYSAQEDCDGRGVYTDLRKFDSWIRETRDALLKEAGPSPDEWQHRYFESSNGTRIAIDYQLKPVGLEKQAKVVWVNLSNPAFKGDESVEVELNSYINSLLKQKGKATYAGDQRFTFRFDNFEGKAVCAPNSRWGIQQDLAVTVNGTVLNPRDTLEGKFALLFCER